MGFKDLPLINKLYERGANYELGQSISAVSMLTGSGGDAINVLQEYAGTAWKCIDIRAEKLSGEDLFVEQFVGGKWQPAPNHEFNKVLEGGDGQTDLSELLEAHEKSMCLFGESFWYFSKTLNSRKPFGVYLLNPNYMTVFVKDKRVTGYLYQEEGERITFELDEIAHFKVNDWRHPFRGTGAMQSAGWFIRSSRYTMTYLNNFMENNAIPAGVIVADTANDDDWKLFKQQWQSKYSGIDNAGKTGFVRGQGLEFIKTGLSLGEVDFEKIKQANREDIMFMFGISKPMAAIFDDINYASALTAKGLFAESITEPSLRRLSRKLTKKLNLWYGSNTIRIGHTDPVPENDEVRLTRLEKGTNKWMTVNEARISDGLEPLGAEYDKITIPQTSPTPPTAKTLGKIKIRTKTNTVSFNYEMKESFRSKMEDLQIKYETKFLQTSNPILKAQKEMVLNQLKPKKALTDTNFDETKEAEKLATEIYPVFIELAKEHGELAAQFVGSSDTTFELTEPTKNYIKESVARAALGFTTETKDKIATALAEGLQAGDSIAKISTRISKLYEEVLGVKTPGYRIERLARTEVIKTSNEITETAYKQSGVVQKKEWFANPGHCGYCANLNGSTINLGGIYAPKGSILEGKDGETRVNSYEDIKHPPVHPACRCTLIPVIEK